MIFLALLFRLFWGLPNPNLNKTCTVWSIWNVSIEPFELITITVGYRDAKYEGHGNWKMPYGSHLA